MFRPETRRKKRPRPRRAVAISPLASGCRKHGYPVCRKLGWGRRSMASKKKAGRPPKQKRFWQIDGLKMFKDTEDQTTNNFIANMWGLIFLNLLFMMGAWLGGFYTVKTFGMFVRHLSLLNLSYIISSYWLSPDLDHRFFRPGHHSFPFGPVRSLVPWGIQRFFWWALHPIHKGLNAIWRRLWWPMGQIFTHRGALHWPVYGTAIKLFYGTIFWGLLGSAVKVILILVPMRGVSNVLGGLVPTSFSPIYWFSKDLLPFIAKTPWTWLFLAAWVVADILHIAVDYYDSVKHNPPKAFCSRSHPRGLIIGAIGGLKQIKRSSAP